MVGRCRHTVIEIYDQIVAHNELKDDLVIRIGRNKWTLCSNPMCDVDYPHSHEGRSIDNPPSRASWPLRLKWSRHRIPPLNLLQFGWFSSHSQFQLPWKIDCDAFREDDWKCIADIIRWKFVFSNVIGVPRGGLRLQYCLEPFIEIGYPTLIVDDVLTTGKSMEEVRSGIDGSVIGVVVFARGPVPDWVWPIFTVNEWSQSRTTGLE